MPQGDRLKEEIARYIITQEKQDFNLSLADSIYNEAKELEKIAVSSKSIDCSFKVKDSYGNVITSTGTDDKIKSFTTYGFDNSTMNYMLWTALYSSSWVFRRAIDKPSQDEIRCGITLLGEADKTKVYEELQSFEFNLIELLQWGALYGGSIALIMVEGLKDDDYANPLDEKKLKDAKTIKLYVTDRWYGCAQRGTETVTNMSDEDFGKPKLYSVVFPNGKELTVHHDYILRYEHRTAPKLIKNGQLQGWGYAEGAHILNELARDDQLKAAITSLVNKALIEVVKMDGMRGVFMGAASTEEENQLTRRLEMVNWARSYNSLTLLDKEDEYQMNNFSGLGGLSDLLEKNMWLVSAAVEMQGVLYGDLKQGFSDDTNALQRYDDTINGRCKSYVQPIYRKLLKMLYIRHDIKEKVQFTFNSLLTKEQDKDKMEGLERFTRICSQLLQDGVYNAKLYAKAIQTYTSKGIVDFGLNDEEIDKIQKEYEQQNEDVDLDEK